MLVILSKINNRTSIKLLHLKSSIKYLTDHDLNIYILTL
jgi:hypothetical protein